MKLWIPIKALLESCHECINCIHEREREGEREGGRERGREREREGEREEGEAFAQSKYYKSGLNLNVVQEHLKIQVVE